MSRSKRSRRDLGPLEFALTTLLIVVLVWLTIHKLSALEAAAERASFTATVNRMKSAVMLEALHHLVRDDRAALAALDQLNPMELMANRPGNYAGVVDSAVGLEPGSWYYDRAAKQLLYVFDRMRPASERDGADGRSRLRVRVLYVDRDHDGVFGPGVDDFTGVTLEPARGDGSDAPGRALSPRRARRHARAPR